MTGQDVEQKIADNQNLVYFVINKRFYGLRHDEDIVQVGRIGLWNACKSYDESKSKFSTYAVRCITNAINKELRYRAKSQGPDTMVSLDAPIKLDDDSNATTFAQIIPSPNNDFCVVDYDVSCLREKLSERDMKIYAMSIDGYSATEIARIYGCSKAWTSAIIRKARAAAREAMPRG